MIETTTDIPGNLLRIRYSRHVEPNEAKANLDRVKLLLAEFRPGFQLLADLTDLESMDLGCAPHLKRAMDLCNQKGVARVVRVIPDPQKDIGLNIMSVFHYRHSIPIVTHETLEQAMATLKA